MDQLFRKRVKIAKIAIKFGMFVEQTLLYNISTLEIKITLYFRVDGSLNFTHQPQFR